MNPDSPNFEIQWKAKEEELRDKRRRFMGKDINSYFAWQKDCNDKIEALYPEEGERKKYYLYHVLIGSTPDSRVEYFDFPGECSIEKMIEDLSE